MRIFPFRAYGIVLGVRFIADLVEQSWRGEWVVCFPKRVGCYEKITLNDSNEEHILSQDIHLGTP